MDINDFRRWTRRKLGQDGECTVKVELTDGQLDQALDDAKDWWNAGRGLFKEAEAAIGAEQAEVDLSAVTPRIDAIVQVWFPADIELVDFRGMYPGFLDVNGIPYGMLGIGGGNSPQGTIVQVLQSIESAQRILSSDPAWEFYRDDFDKDHPVRILRLMPAPTMRSSGKLVYLYRVDPRDIKLHMYGQRDLWLIRDWALAEAKYMLGRIRGKYPGGLPAAGSDRQLDGEALISEAMADKERLEAKILDYGGPVMPVVG